MTEILKTLEGLNQKIIVSFFKDIERQGPGTDDETRRALQFIPALKANSKILDIGCGAGQQTAVLAAETPAQIIATDIASDLLEIVKQRTAIYGDRVQTLATSMDILPLAENSFDLIWAEGAAYIIGMVLIPETRRNDRSQRNFMAHRRTS